MKYYHGKISTKKWHIYEKQFGVIYRFNSSKQMCFQCIFEGRKIVNDFDILWQGIPVLALPYRWLFHVIHVHLPEIIGLNTEHLLFDFLQPPLTSLFKKAAGSWECPTCMINNKPEQAKCVACGTANPKPSSVPVTVKTSPVKVSS